MRKRLEPGDRIGKTVAIELCGKVIRGGEKKAQWRWMCDSCGSEFLAAVDYRRKTCGCGRFESLASRHNAENAEKCAEMIGQRFGRLTVIGMGDTPRPGLHRFWICLCDCGNEKLATRSNLSRGKTTSCGCYHKEVAAKTSAEARAGLARVVAARKSTIMRGLFGLPAATIKKQRLGKVSARHVCRDES